MRNVYKTSSKVARATKEAVQPYKKVLLTATPLQNSLLELFGLVSVIDDTVLGDLRSFRNQYARLNSSDTFEELKDRLKPVCNRTLRRQVLEYIRFTSRHAITQEFFPSDTEQALYNMVSDYLKRDKLWALPTSQRQLMTLILRKLLASSTYAISSTLDRLSQKLSRILEEAKTYPPEEDLIDLVEEDMETAREYWEETESDNDSEENSSVFFTEDEIEEIKTQMDIKKESP